MQQVLPHNGLFPLLLFGIVFQGLSLDRAWAETIDFEDLTLPPDSHFEGTDMTPYDWTATDNPWTSRGMTFHQFWALDAYLGYEYTWWYGVTYSNHTWTGTPPSGLAGQYTAYPPGGSGGPGGAGGSNNCAVVFCPADSHNDGKTSSYTIDLPDGKQILRLSVANTCYVWDTIKTGDPFGFSRRFGWLDANGNGNYNDPGDYTGDYPDYFLLTILGLDGSGEPIAASPVDVYLADYRFADSQQDFILQSWQEVDLSGLEGAEKLLFRLSSTDVGVYGMNTPAYFVLDNIVLSDMVLSEIPEPASCTLFGLGMGAWAFGTWWSRRRQRL